MEKQNESFFLDTRLALVRTKGDIEQKIAPQKRNKRKHSVSLNRFRVLVLRSVSIVFKIGEYFQKIRFVSPQNLKVSSQKRVWLDFSCFFQRRSFETFMPLKKIPTR